MKRDIQQRIVALRNELQSQKVFSGLTYSQLLLPENLPTQTYSGNASLSGDPNSVVARVRFRFTRTDGLMETPAINFTQECKLSPTYAEFVRGNGFTVSGNDLGYYNQWEVSSYVSEIGDGYVDFTVDLQSSCRRTFFSIDSIAFETVCQAITSVRGILTVERLI